MKDPLAIVGGGPAGLAAALALQLRGVFCPVFERAPRLEEIGAASRVIGRMIQWESSRLCAARDLGLRLTPQAVTTLGIRRLLDFHPQTTGVASSAK